MFAVAGLADDTPERLPGSLTFDCARHDWQMRILSRKSDHRSRESVSMSPGQMGPNRGDQMCYDSIILRGYLHMFLAVCPYMLHYVDAK